LRKFLCTPKGVMRYSPVGLMRYNDSNAIVDDMPLLSQWIKKIPSPKTWNFLSFVSEKELVKKRGFSYNFITFYSVLTEYHFVSISSISIQSCVPVYLSSLT